MIDRLAKLGAQTIVHWCTLKLWNIIDDMSYEGGTKSPRSSRRLPCAHCRHMEHMHSACTRVDKTHVFLFILSGWEHVEVFSSVDDVRLTPCISSGMYQPRIRYSDLPIFRLQQT